jgi:hypothetical protein
MFGLIYAIMPSAREEALAAGGGIGLVGARHDTHFGMRPPRKEVGPGNLNA